MLRPSLPLSATRTWFAKLAALGSTLVVLLLAAPPARAACSPLDVGCTVEEVVETTVGDVDDVVAPVVETVEDTVTDVVETTRPVVDIVVDTVRDVVDDAVTIVEDVVSEVVGPIEDVTDPGEGGIAPSGPGAPVPDRDPAEPVPGSDPRPRPGDVGPGIVVTAPENGITRPAPGFVSAGFTTPLGGSAAVATELVSGVSIGSDQPAPRGVPGIAAVAGALAFPAALVVLVMAFLAIQNRLDRRDPKLAVAPVGPDVLAFS